MHHLRGLLGAVAASSLSLCFCDCDLGEAPFFLDPNLNKPPEYIFMVAAPLLHYVYGLTGKQPADRWLIFVQIPFKILLPECPYTSSYLSQSPAMPGTEIERVSVVGTVRFLNSDFSQYLFDALLKTQSC